MQDTDTTITALADPAFSIAPVEAKERLSHVIMLAHRIWPEAYKDILSPEEIRNMLAKIYTHENLQQEMKNGHQFHIAYLGQMPVGYASAFIEGDVIWLKKLYVDQNHKGKRIGARLMHAAVAPLLPASEIRVLANRDNVPAHRFYEHLGFDKVGEVPVTMGDGQYIDFLFSMSLVD